MFVSTNQSNLIFSASYKVGPLVTTSLIVGEILVKPEIFVRPIKKQGPREDSAFIAGSGIHLLRIHAVAP